MAGQRHVGVSKEGNTDLHWSRSLYSLVTKAGLFVTCIVCLDISWESASQFLTFSASRKEELEYLRVAKAYEMLFFRREGEMDAWETWRTVVESDHFAVLRVGLLLGATTCE